MTHPKVWASAIALIGGQLASAAAILIALAQPPVHPPHRSGGRPGRHAAGAGPAAGRNRPSPIRLSPGRYEPGRYEPGPL